MLGHTDRLASSGTFDPHRRAAPSSGACAHKALASAAQLQHNGQGSSCTSAQPLLHLQELRPPAPSPAVPLLRDQSCAAHGASTGRQTRIRHPLPAAAAERSDEEELDHGRSANSDSSAPGHPQSPGLPPAPPTPSDALVSARPRGTNKTTAMSVLKWVRAIF